MQSAALVKEQIKPCPVCAGVPRVIAGLFGGYFVICVGHAETMVVQTREEAVQRWNEGKLDT